MAIRPPSASTVRRAKTQAVGGKRKRCVKGKSCSAACIAANMDCLVDFPDVVQGSLGKVRNLVNSKQGQGSPAPNPQPAPTPEKKIDKGEVPDKDLWQSAAKGDYTKVKAQTDKWAKEHGLSMLDGHDHAHSMIHSYLGVNSDILARIGRGKKGDISPMEEGIVYHFDNLGKKRRGLEGTPIERMSKQEISDTIAPMIRGLSEKRIGKGNPIIDQNIQRATNILYNLQSRPDYGQFADSLSKTQSDLVEESFKALYR